MWRIQSYASHRVLLITYQSHFFLTVVSDVVATLHSNSISFPDLPSAPLREVGNVRMQAVLRWRPKVYIVSRGSGGMLSQVNFVKLDARRWILRPFLGPTSHMFCNSKANRTSVVATNPLKLWGSNCRLCVTLIVHIVATYHRICEACPCNKKVIIAQRFWFTLHGTEWV